MPLPFNVGASEFDRAFRFYAALLRARPKT
jgi:hypothetical protein